MQDDVSFARELPHHPRELIFVIVTHNPSALFVPASRVRGALVWLGTHNIWYNNFEINERTLGLLPENGNVHHMLPSLNISETIFQDPHENEQIHETGAPSADQVNQAQRIHAVLDMAPKTAHYPTMSESPVNEFTAAGYIAQAFPCLFPTGKAGFRDNSGRVTKTKHFQHLCSSRSGSRNTDVLSFCYEQSYALECTKVGASFRSSVLQNCVKGSLLIPY